MSYYGTTEDFIEYLDARGKELPGTVSEDDIAAALLVASEWLDGVYGNLFSGYKTGGYSQEREWPRSAAFTNTTPVYNFPTDAIPIEVEKATYEAAYRQAISPGSLQVDYTPGKYKRVSIDGAVSVEYADFSSASEIQIQIGAIDMILAPLLNALGADFSTLSGSVSRV